MLIVQLEYRKQDKIQDAIDILLRALEAPSFRRQPQNLFPIYSLLGAFYLRQARNAPKIILPTAREDRLGPDTQTKDHWLDMATSMLNNADRIEAKWSPNWVCKGILQQSKGNFDEALKAFDAALQIDQTNTFALLGKACCLYARKNFRSALKLYQNVLKCAPRMLSPDPRIGIGLCFYRLGMQEEALNAFTRAGELNPQNPHALMVLGLWYINNSRDINQPANDEERAAMYARGVELAGRAFKIKKELAAAAVVLAGLQIVKGKITTATKLSERAIQYSGSKRGLSEAYYQLARGYHTTKEFDSAARYYQLAYEASTENTLAAIGLGQMQIQRNEVQLAKVTFDNILKKDPRCVEAMTVLGSLYAQFPSKSDEKAERARAKQLFEQAIKIIADLQQNPNSARILDDADLFVELAQLWEESSLDRGLLGYEKARDTRVELGLDPSPEITNNIAASRHLKAELEEAKDGYETAIAEAQALAEKDADYDPDALLTSIMYNLGHVFEDLGDAERAKEIYESILGRHPNYVDAKIRLGCVFEAQNDHKKAHELYKEAFDKHSSDSQVRGFFGCHLESQARGHKSYLRQAAEVHVNTLREHSKSGNDPYALTALGNIALQQARDRQLEPGETEEQRRKAKSDKYKRAAEYYYQALKQEPGNAYAAQGIAVLLAEDRAMATTLDGRMRDLKEAISILSRVRDTLNDESVYVNLGHVFYEREESLKAIEAYETALRKHGEDEYHLLLYLAKAWEQRIGSIEPSKRFAILVQAIDYTRRALALRPKESSIQFNVAYLQQRAAQVMLYELQPSDRTLADLKASVEWGETAKATFEELHAAKNLPPQLLTLADQRAKFGTSLSAMGPEQIKQQEEYEKKVEEQQAEVRRRREQDDRRRQEEEARLKAEREAAAAALAEERKEMMSRLAEWNEKKLAERSDKSESEDEVGEPKESKKKEKKREKRKKADVEADSEDAELFGDGLEDGAAAPPSPKKRKGKLKRKNEDAPPTESTSKKQFKSAEFIESDDEDM